ncbi:MAG: Hint domain-containing protein, partial [Candidatus Dormibacteraceae bacterium]
MPPALGNLQGEVAEFRISGSPDRMIMVIPKLSGARARRIANDAVREARKLMPKMTGRAASRLFPIYGYGYFGVGWLESYTWFQEQGIRPFTMYSLAGKAQPLDEPILTPCGWRRMGDIQPGNEVIGSDGKPVIVTGVFPQGNVACYRVRFKDGTSARCSGEHLWEVKRRVHFPSEVRDTNYLRKRLNTTRCDSWQIRTPQA